MGGAYFSNKEKACILVKRQENVLIKDICAWSGHRMQIFMYFLAVACGLSPYITPTCKTITGWPHKTSTETDNLLQWGVTKYLQMTASKDKKIHLILLDNVTFHSTI